MALTRSIDLGAAVDQAKVEVLSFLSDKIRTPISVVLGNTEVIMRETGESYTASHAINIQAAARTMLLLVSDIVDLTNIHNKTLKLEEGSFSVLSLLQDVIAYAEYSTDEKHLELKLDIDENLPRGLWGDAIRLTQIFNNLMSNAIKYTSEGFVELIIRWQALGSGGKGEYGILSVQVRDSGIGMKEETVDRLMGKPAKECGSQAEETEKADLEMGLFIVRNLLELMGSKLQIESDYGKGSTFSFCVVHQIMDPAPVGKRKSREGRHILMQMEAEQKILAPSARILVVDDSTMNQDLFRGILKGTKIKIDTANNGQEAVEKLREQKYHLVFMDHMMPVMDGVEALNKIREENLCPDVPIVVLTANVAPGAKEQYLEAGFDDYLSKPVIPQLLEAAIKKHLPERLIKERWERGDEDKTGDSQEQELSPFLQQLTLLDTSVGMSYFADNEEFYRDMIRCYLENSSYEDIDRDYETEDWENYRILVHALKSTSLSIGAVQLSNEAKDLEMAAKDGRIGDIRRNHDAMMERFKSLLEQIEQVLGSKQEEKVKAVSVQEEDKACILVVDDDSMNLRIAEKMLESQFHIECVKSGKEALEFVERQIPNLILLDLHMPEMDGFQVIKALRSEEKYREIPVIFLTADNDRDTEVKGFREGALDFIAKPFIADITISRVNRILELSRLQKDLQREVKKQTRTAEERRQKVERLSSQIMTTLAGTIDAKDKYTKGHSSRVAEYALKIARKLGKSEKEQEDIYYLGLLHDIGKIGIPDGIINKTTRLNDEEYAVIRTHPVIGAEILANISELPELVMGAKWHHERYDGKGYPDGLKGEEIPEMARIIGVADAYDAMTSNRSYRNVLPQNVVRGEIEKGKGTQFDPLFADKMIEMIDEDVEYQMREK